MCLPYRTLFCCEGRESGQGSVFSVTLRKKGQFTGCRQGLDPRCACRPASASGRISPEAKEMEAQQTAPHSPTVSLQRENKALLLCPELVGATAPCQEVQVTENWPQSLSPEGN